MTKENAITEPVCDFCSDEASIFGSSDTSVPVNEMCIVGMTSLSANGAKSTKHIYVSLDDCTEIWSRPIAYCPFCGRSLTD